MTARSLILVRSDAGDGGWSLHPAGSTNEQIAEGEAPILASGTATWDTGLREWDRPNEADYLAAERAASKLAEVEARPNERDTHGRGWLALEGAAGSRLTEAQALIVAREIGALNSLGVPDLRYVEDVFDSIDEAGWEAALRRATDDEEWDRG